MRSCRSSESAWQIIANAATSAEPGYLAKAVIDIHMLRDDRTAIACESAYGAEPSSRAILCRKRDNAGLAGWRISLLLG